MRTYARRLLSAGALAVVVAAGLTACGSDSGSSNDTTAATSGAAAGSGNGGSDASVDVPKGDSNSDLCKYARELEQSNAEQDFTDLDKEQFEKFQEIVGNIQDKAPDEIKADIDKLASAWGDIKAVFAKYDYDLAKLGQAAAKDPELQAKLESFSTGDFATASARIDAYFKETCGIDPGSS
jgi:hypothetical protein